MKRAKPPSAEASDLRRKAEARLQTTRAETPLPATEAETQRLLHELQVHQVELEMQNEELRQARDEKEAALARYAELFEFAPVGYVTLDPVGTVGTANLTAATLLGIERSRLLGRRLGLFIAAESRSAFKAFLGRVFSHQEQGACEAVFLKAGVMPLIARIEAVADASGQECRAVIIDISARRQMEETLSRLHAALIDRAAELESANAELEAFNYSVSHDLRGPLTIIAGYCEVIERSYGSQLDESCRGYLREINASTMRMKELIDTLLAFSKVKRVEMRQENVDLSKSAQEAITDVKRKGPKRPVRFKLAEGLVAKGDARLLQIVLNNLLDNAWKYSAQQKEALIEFGMTEADGKPAYYVRDNGSGFNMAHAEELFSPFQQLPGTETQGHGIGLAIVEKIIRRHGGRVWAESRPEEGATFFFTLGEAQQVDAEQ